MSQYFLPTMKETPSEAQIVSHRLMLRAGLIRQNIEAFGLTGVTRIYRRDATDLGDAGNRDPFGLVFVDPPYGKGLGERALASAAAGGWLAPGAQVNHWRSCRAV